METEMSFQGGALIMLICIHNRYVRSVLSTEMYIKTFYHCQVFFPFSHGRQHETHTPQSRALVQKLMAVVFKNFLLQVTFESLLPRYMSQLIDSVIISLPFRVF
jgi:hypothetical protein